jgi:phage terminase Nu1 subunit (DNA packaging protein)
MPDIWLSTYFLLSILAIDILLILFKIPLSQKMRICKLKSHWWHLSFINYQIDKLNMKLAMIIQKRSEKTRLTLQKIEISF